MAAIKIVAILSCALLVLCLAGIAIRSARRLDQKIADLRADEESSDGVVQDPYQALAELYSEHKPDQG
jgi:hypothetical protein